MNDTVTEEQWRRMAREREQEHYGKLAPLRAHDYLRPVAPSENSLLALRIEVLEREVKGLRTKIDKENQDAFVITMFVLGCMLTMCLAMWWLL